MNNRIIGFDVSRAFAVFGMVIVNFKIAMQVKSGSEILIWFSGLFEGRASALFVVLAGIGVTFLTNKARLSEDSQTIKKARWSLLKRGGLLFGIGLAYTPIWPADILHFYGLYFIIAAMIFTVRDKKLLWLSLFFTGFFVILLGLFDYDKGWNWSDFSYDGFWTFDGMIRHVFFNGFHPVFPWMAFLLIGLWLGRQDLGSVTMRKRYGLYAFLIWAITEGLFAALRWYFTGHESVVFSAQDAGIVFSTSIIPPFPQYIVAAGSLAVLLIMISLHVCDRFANNRVIGWLYQTGQMALTLYVAHVIVGMGTLEFLNMLSDQSIEVSLISAFIFCALSVAFSVLWLKKFRQGPLEWLFRKLIH